MMTLYYARGTCALASHIALEQAGAQYEARRVDFSRNEQRSPEYMRINPKARVPSLVTPRGVLTETPAILAFVAQQYPAARLAPIDDPWAFADAMWHLVTHPEVMPAMSRRAAERVARQCGVEATINRELEIIRGLTA